MRTIRIKLYKFDELSKEAQANAIEKLSDINLDYEWWDSCYDDFAAICRTIGIDIDLKKTYFTGFYHQGQGSAFTADIDVPKLIASIKAQTWKEYAPLVEFNFQPITKNMERFVKLSQDSDSVYLSANIIPANRETAVQLAYTSNYLSGMPNIEKADEDLEDFLQDVADTLNNWFFDQLRSESDYRSSETAIIETIKANEYEFTKDGKLA